MKLAVFATLLATTSAFSINKADIGKVRPLTMSLIRVGDDVIDDVI
jgi:hypothetical protein